MMYTAFFGSLAVTTLALIGLVRIYRGRRRPYTAASSCPPGPKVAVMPTHDAWVEYQKWGNDYGELV